VCGGLLLHGAPYLDLLAVQKPEKLERALLAGKE